ncbi:MAG TPA: outer membrane beta-barrel protein [Chitinophaga sp.]|uniref:outer membrane beta-barrel protein n=1 Tax=Chitinophaga sp. TaxID=1869181 RepID=UPI002B820436|nr:outer membrane beta-barrel protein [Chitinophaga sp.]HVI45725.1 outer membrane beta-barrel protein [Chitinophaga sp.]
MKYLILVIFLVLQISHVAAQQLKIEAGLNLARGMGGMGVEAFYGSMLPGLKAGIAADFDVSGPVGVQTGIFFQQCGSVFPVADKETGNFSNSVLRLNYLQLPLLITGYFSLSPATGLLLGAGPYTAWLLNDKAYGLKYLKNKNHFIGYLDNDATTTLQRLDYGLSFTNSFEIRRMLSITLQVDYGLRNLSRQGDDSVLRNQSFNCSIGYIISRRKAMLRKPRASQMLLPMAVL